MAPKGQILAPQGPKIAKTGPKGPKIGKIGPPRQICTVILLGAGRQPRASRALHIPLGESFEYPLKDLLLF